MVRSFEVLAACVVSCACATTRFTESRIEAAPSEAKGHAGSRVSVAIRGMKVWIETLDRSPRGKTISPLTLRVTFEPRELGYWFDPGQVVLRDANGSEWRTRGEGYRPLYPGTQCDLAFDAFVLEEAGAQLVLGGLARGQERLSPVTLHLARHEGRSIDRIYWLEVLLAPLVYSPYAR